MADLIEQPAPEVPRPVRFCAQCGNAREPQQAECAHCAVHLHTHSAADEQYRLDIRSIRSALWLYFVLLGLSAAFIVFHTVTGHEGSALSEFASGGAFAFIVLCWAIPYFGQIVSLLRAGFEMSWMLLAICAAAPTYLLANLACQILYLFSGLDEVSYLTNFTRDGYGFSWAVLAICVQPAVFEEIAFRGIIQDSLTRVLGARESLIVTALMFGILHLSIPSLPHLLALGLVLGWLRLRTQSLLPGMALHFTHNFLVLVGEKYESWLPW
ncbi:MAG: CPBP family intramembrane glutamic endopeptidase [Candidatus Binatia bacterium]